MSTLIKDGLIVTVDGSIYSDVYIDNGQIITIGKNIGKQLKVPPEETIDAKGMYILPGAIDPHTHISMPFMGTHSQDDYSTGTISAACGGVTSIIDFDIQQKGESIHQALERKKELANGNAVIDYSLHPAITDLREEVISEIKTAIKNYGTPSFKVFMTYDFRVDDATLLKMLAITKENGGLVQLHAENYYMIEYLNAKFKNENKLAPYYHALSRPNIAEQEAISRAIKLVELTGSSLYIVHLSSKEGLEEVKLARDKGLKIYAETCPQYLLLNDTCYKEPNWNGAKYVMSPPIRTKESNDALWDGINSGDIQTIGTDHCPFDFSGVKDMFGKDDYKKIPNGAPGIELPLILLHSEGVNKGRITLEKMVEIMSTNTAKIFGLKNKGAILPGKDADIVIFNPKQKFKITNEKLHMNVDYSPFENLEVTGMPNIVFSKGKKVAQWNGEKMDFIGNNAAGNFIKRSELFNI